MSKNHEHKLGVCSWSGHPDGPHPFTISFRCKDTSLVCNERAERLGTREEFEKLHTPIEWDEENNVHTVAHAFDREFHDENTGAWKLTGYPLMKAIEAFAEKYPEHITITRCDDTWFTGSDIVLIEHRTETQYMGVTLIYVPQNSNGTDSTPSELFLYPGASKALMNALEAIEKRRLKIFEIEAAAQRKRSDMLDTIKP